MKPSGPSDALEPRTPERHAWSLRRLFNARDPGARVSRGREPAARSQHAAHRVLIWSRQRLRRNRRDRPLLRVRGSQGCEAGGFTPRADRCDAGALALPREHFAVTTSGSTRHVGACRESCVWLAAAAVAVASRALSLTSLCDAADAADFYQVIVIVVSVFGAVAGIVILRCTLHLGPCKLHCFYILDQALSSWRSLCRCFLTCPGFHTKSEAWSNLPALAATCGHGRSTSTDKQN